MTGVTQHAACANRFDPLHAFALYELRDDAGVFWVGVSRNLRRRLRSHRASDSLTWPRSVTSTCRVLALFDDKQAALQTETRLIRSYRCDGVTLMNVVERHGAFARTPEIHARVRAARGEVYHTVGTKDRLRAISLVQQEVARVERNKSVATMSHQQLVVWLRAHAYTQTISLAVEELREIAIRWESTHVT